MSNDMKLIMEEWRKVLLEITQDIIDDPESAARQTSPKQMTPERAEQLISKIGKLSAYRKMKDWRNSGSIWWDVVNFIDITGVTDWPEVEEAWNEYMDWYNLQDSDPNKDPKKGDELFGTFVFSVMAAIPMVDVVPYLARAIGLKATEGFLKGIAKELGLLFGTPLFLSIFGANDKVIQFQKEVDKYLDYYRHGKQIQRLPLGKQKGSSKRYSTFDRKKRAMDPEYYPAQKK